MNAAVRKAICNIVLAALAVTPATAQPQPFIGSWDLTSNSVQTMQENMMSENIMEGLLRDSRAEKRGQERSFGETRPLQLLAAPAARDQVAVDLPFSYNPAVSRRVQSKLLEGVGKTTAEGAQEVKRALASGAMRRTYEEGLGSLGVRPTDGLDAMASYLMVAWAVTNNANPSPSPAMFRAVRGQVGSAYATTPDILDTPDKRQEFGESLIYQVVILDNLHTAMLEMPAAERERIADQMHAASVKLLGYDLRDLRLTGQGFRPRQSGAASEAPATPGEAVPAQQAAAPAEDGPSYTLLAAVGGAGLGTAFLLGKVMGRPRG